MRCPAWWRPAWPAGRCRADKPGLAGRAGSARAAAQALARSAGTSLGEARRAIAAGQAMADQPEVAAAARAGEQLFATLRTG